MRRKWSLIVVGVLVLCVVGMVPVLAQGPGGNPIYATIEYVDQMVAELYEYIDQQIAAVYAYVDEQIGGGGGVAPPSWELAEAYEWYWTWPGEDTEVFLRAAGLGCVLSESPSMPFDFNPGPAWGVAHFPDADLHFSGSCNRVEHMARALYAEELPESDIEVEIWVEWLGETKYATYTVSPVTIP